MSFYGSKRHKLAHWRLEALGAHEYDGSLDELTHDDKPIQRILMLDRQRDLQELHLLHIGTHSPEALHNDLALEETVQAQCQSAIKYCGSVRDFVSREILVELLDFTENHINWLGTKISLADKIGSQNYEQPGMHKLT